MRQRRHHVQSLATGCLAETFEADCREPRAHFQSSLDHRAESDIGRRIEVEHQAAGHLGLVGLAIPRMQLDAPALRDRGECLDAIDDHIRLMVTGNLNQIERSDMPGMA